jgi:release factor glutamine methyltransferase
MTVQQHYANFITTLSPTIGEGEAHSIARILFEDYFNLKPKKQNENQDTLFNTLLIEEYHKIIERLLKHEPIQYIVGFAWFYGLKLKVNPTVLIPRPETEELVHWILETIKEEKLPSNLSLLDIGTGSGCIPTALKKRAEHLKITAIDVSESALITASRNANRYELYDLEFKKIDILSQTERTTLPKYDLIVSNPPYIPTQEKTLMQENVLDYEPHLALFVDDNDALVFYKTIAQFALTHLNPNGHLFFECNEYNANEVVELLKETGYHSVDLQKDLSGRDRMVRARL